MLTVWTLSIRCVTWIASPSFVLLTLTASLDTTKPLLDRTALTAVFSNFIDIWSLHQSFCSSLSFHLPGLFQRCFPSPTFPNSPVAFPLSPSLHTFYYLFPTMISALASLTSPSTSSGITIQNSSRNSIANSSSIPPYNPALTAFITPQEQDPRCRKLKLRAWLLTIVHSLLLTPQRSCRIMPR